MRSVRFLLVILSVFGLVACSKHQAAPTPPSAQLSACSGDPYLMKYGCSMNQIQQAAERGDPDAQYALGYMYYYGVETAKDQNSAKLWIARAASQGQPLAKRAMAMLEGTGTLPAHKTHKPTRSPSPLYASVQQHAALKRARTHAKAATADTPMIATTTKAVTPVASVIKKAAPIKKVALIKKAAPVTRASKSIGQMEASLMKAPSTGYTLQLMGNHHEGVVTQFIQKHHIQGKAKYYYSSFHKGKWYMLVYGQYKTVGEAHAAIAKLPHDLRRMQPWIKPNRDVKAEIKTRHLVS
ncbi:MAG: SPOR domain-containing protein [Mariprofundaceae bacterium]|nr:SPOR domain-containing protein [Mariprofundaceae bacterium]